MRVIITGAAGQIGSQVVEELSPSHDLRLIDLRPVNGRESIVANLSRRPVTKGWRGWFQTGYSRWSNAFEGAEVVVHLAAEIRTSGLWEEVLSNNIQATWNIIEAAAKFRVSRVVFASSNWAVKALERELAPACYLPGGVKIGSDAPPRPITPYGISKAFGEIIGRNAVDEGRLASFVGVRIGSYLPAPPEDEERRRRWIGIQDIRSLLRHCVEAEFKGFHIVYGVSAQPIAPYDLSHTRQLLSWAPQQTS